MNEKDSDKTDLLFWKIALKDDEEAFRSLFFDFFSPLCVFAHRYIESWDTCEDMVQDTFFRIWKNRKGLAITHSGRNFLLTSVRNSCIDYLRKQDMELSWKQRETQEQTACTTDELYSRMELEGMLRNALSQLPETSRSIFEKNRFEGKTYTEIATEEGISVKTVEAHISKALKQLRIELRDYLPLCFLFL